MLPSCCQSIVVLCGAHQTTYTLVGVCVCVCRESHLQLIPVPTPRWPDLLCVYHKTDRLLFTSNMFSAHVAPSVVNTSGESAADVGGWDMYGQDWRHYYDCMLAPVAKQAAGLCLRWLCRHEGAVCVCMTKIQDPPFMCRCMHSVSIVVQFCLGFSAY